MTSWPELMDRFGPVVWKTAYRLLGNEQDAADCFQETFLSAVRLRAGSQVNHWGGLLRRLAVARALDRLRQRGREARRRGPMADCSALPARGEDPGAAAQVWELAGRLRAALRSLPRRQAEVFCLHCLEELPHEQIGRQMGLRAGAVGALLHRARRRLRVLLASDAPRAGRQGRQER